jgi:hypothetical protein
MVKYNGLISIYQRREICDIINILVREIKFILFYEKNDHIRKILKTALQEL